MALPIPSPVLSRSRPARRVPVQRVLCHGAVLTLLCFLGCGGSAPPPGPPTPPPLPVVLAPLSSSVVAGQSLQFSLSSGLASGVTWSVIPSADGTFAASGLFTAGQTPGTCTITAAYTLYGKPAATRTTLTILAPPLPLDLDPETMVANGGDQVDAGGILNNATIFSEGVGLAPSTNASGTLQNQPGFDLATGSNPAGQGHEPKHPYPRP